MVHQTPIRQDDLVGEPVAEKASPSDPTPNPVARPTIWIDLDNTPHVPFFKPIVAELRKRGLNITLTARDAFQVCELAAQMGFHATRVGKHYGKNPLAKVTGLLWRAAQLLPFALREKPILALSHGSRAQLLLCNLLRIPTVMLMDYEHARMPLLLRPRWEIVPDALIGADLHCKPTRIRSYPGIKEDVYAHGVAPDPELPHLLHIDNGDIIVTVRPPASEAHYHSAESDRFFVDFMERVRNTPQVTTVLLPRNTKQEVALRKWHPEWFETSKVIIPDRTVDGVSLLWYSDLVVSGGGTMNREAAAMGVPVYSIFRGPTGAVDVQLEKEGRLVLIRSLDEVRTKIALCKRSGAASRANTVPAALVQIVDHILDIVRIECGAESSDAIKARQPL